MIGSRGRGRGRDLQPLAEINVTSMVDVAFTLLIIFIITAPILQGGIEVEVPETDVASLTVEDNTLIVTVDREGVVYVGETPMTLAEFEGSFAQLVSGGTVDAVHLKGDSLAAWGVGVGVMSAVRSAGISLSIIAEQRPRR